MTLQNTQAEFVDLLLSEDGKTDLLKPLQNMAIYRNNITISLVNTLLDTYPLITRLVGEDFFRLAAKDYIKHYPSCSGNLHDYGQYVSDFLAAYLPVKNLTYLPDVARFEWVCHCLQFAADPPPFDSQRLENMPSCHYDHLHAMLHPASHVIKFHTPILRIIALCKGETKGPIDMNEGGINLLIIRRELDIMLASLTEAEYAFLLSLQDGLSLPKALETAAAIESHFKLDEKLPAWIQDKTIVDVYPA